MTPPRVPTEHVFTTHDGVGLFYRHWPAPAACHAIVLFHRGHEHSGRIAHLVDELDLPDCAFFAWDARGHGRSPGERGFSPSFGTSVRDVDGFIRHLEQAHGIPRAQMAVVAQSVGAVLVSTWLHDYAPVIRAAVLASPAFKVRLYVPFARTGVALREALMGRFFVNSYVKPGLLTHDPGRIRSYETDPYIARPIASHILLGLYAAADRVVADAAAVTVPVMQLTSGADWVVEQQPQRDFLARLSSPLRIGRELPGFFHDTLGEAGRAPVLAEVRTFLRERFDEPLKTIDLRQADQVGPTRIEADALARPYAPWSPLGLYWRFMRFALRLAGRLSRGVQLGHETGFDSGAMLDYVYRNQPEGSNALGRFVDQQYLQSIGWRGIRQRKLHLEELIAWASTALRTEGRRVDVLDVAAGHGRYVLDAFAALGEERRPDSIRLRDFVAANVQSGQRLIAERGLSGVATFEQGDAFDTASLANLDPRPTLAIVSGLFELFSDNAQVGRCIAGLSQAVPPGGYVLYTGQPWHPQLEMIARALTSHRQGTAWVMRRRTQGELDQLFAEGGFDKIEQRIDEWGIFTVSVARRR